MNQEEARVKFGKRVQRCSGCFIPFYVKDMWMSADIAYYCEHCKEEDSMLHFDQYAQDFDFTQLPSMRDEGN